MTKLYAIRKHFRDLPIYKKLVFSFVFLAIFPALFIGILSYCRSSELIKHKTEQYTNDILMEMGNNIENKLREAERVTFQVLSNSIIQNSLKKATGVLPMNRKKLLPRKTYIRSSVGLFLQFRI
ncbi:hypothetical protein ODU73_001701 [Thermoclostridium stercorarium]|uniref:hypothetical protein n=1 Tax=Thermoclostridium stercorarium TaxID=1510 RepID=UPI0022496112|nr:hypothetical protein [Thermoclostridium stercorarium]UZQ84659.1 hypothetical protein ODU73_001701 [Thermoclostridium stercorarium]